MTIDQVKEKYKSFYREFKSTISYETDGMVIKLNDFKSQNLVGSNVKYPKYIIAYKFEVATKITTIKEIELSIGRSGAITPVAIIDPVELDGATISRCTLHNFDEIKRLGIYEKAKVFIKRSGGVIPKITKVATITKHKPYIPPTNCPICNTELIYIDSTLHCPNVLCKGQLKKRIEFMVSREVLDIDGLGSKIIDQLIDKNIINDLPDIFTLTKDDLMSLDRVGDKLASNIIANIGDALPVSFSEFITILCIPKVSVRTAQILVDNYRNIYKLIDDLNNGTFQVNGIGEVVTDSLKQYLNKNKDIIIKFEKVGVSYNS
jgi:DNA ligase (NAD+)